MDRRRCFLPFQGFDSTEVHKCCACWQWWLLLELLSTAMESVACMRIPNRMPDLLEDPYGKWLACINKKERVDELGNP